MILDEVAVRTDDRNLLQQMVDDARDAYSTGSSFGRWAAAHVLVLAAWYRDDVHDAMRWLGGDITLLGTPVFPQVLDRVILGARVASAAASYDLARLRANGLITRIPGKNRYRLTGDGLRFAISYTKVHDRLLRPLLVADQPPAPLVLRKARRTSDIH